MREAFEKAAKDEAGSLNVEQGIMLKSTHCGVSSRQPEDKGVSLCHICAHIATVSLRRTTFGGFDRKEALQLVVRNLWRKI